MEPPGLPGAPKPGCPTGRGRSCNFLLGPGSLPLPSFLLGPQAQPRCTPSAALSPAELAFEKAFRGW